MKIAFPKSYRLAAISTASVVIVVGAKLVVHQFGWERITLNPLFSGLVAANVFLMGFLLSGVLSDYKESEKLPGELAAGLGTIADDFVALAEPKHEAVRREGLAQLLRLATGIHDWLLRRQSTEAILEQVSDLVHLFTRLEPFIPANYTVRLKQEQNNLRRSLIRIDTIRETSFIPSGYVISEIVTALLTVGLVLIKVDLVYEGLFVVGLITFLFSFLALLIRDLDNPFGYDDQRSAEDVSLSPLLAAIERLKQLNRVPPAEAGKANP